MSASTLFCNRNLSKRAASDTSADVGPLPSLALAAFPLGFCAVPQRHGQLGGRMANP